MRRSGRQRGQALPLFVLMIFVVTGSVAVVTDVSWFWVNQEKMQRAADAGALAGAVYLPGNVSGAYAAAQAATARNGYTNGVGNVVVTPQQDQTNKRRLGVTVQGPVGTYFARVFGMNQITAKAKSKAEFTLPVPMGSPQNYYGVGTYLYNQIDTPAQQRHRRHWLGSRRCRGHWNRWTTPANARRTTASTRPPRPTIVRRCGTPSDC